tara:strand:+ start:152 stop:868 length:717 start_codon:yes stop_codon:yes gene_type:complete
MDLCGKPTIQYVIDNMKKVKNAEKIILCTTTLDDDDVLCQIAERSGIEYFRGSVDDKLSRWLGACKKYAVDFFVNVDGDDLFFDKELAERVILQYNESRPDFIDGQGFMYNDVYGITYSALKEICRIKGVRDAEYIKPYFDRFNTQKFSGLDKWKKRNIRMTLDYQEDFNFFETVILGLGDKELSFDNILEFLNENPETSSLNWHMEEQWKSNQDSQISKQKKEQWTHEQIQRIPYWG